jgi:hypothetical protein
MPLCKTCQATKRCKDRRLGSGSAGRTPRIGLHQMCHQRAQLLHRGGKARRRTAGHTTT